MVRGVPCWPHHPVARRAAAGRRKGAPLAALAAVAVALLAGAAAPAGAEEVVLELLPQARVVGPVVRLGDVARPSAGEASSFEELAGLPVGAAPLPGESRSLTRSQIELRLRQARVDTSRLRWAAGPEAVEVVGAAEPVSGELLLRHLQEYVQQAQQDAALARAGYGGPVRVAGLEEGVSVLMPPGPVQVRVVSAPPVLRPGSAVFAVELSHPSGAVRRVWVRARLEPAAAAGLPAPAAASGLAAGGRAQTPPAPSVTPTPTLFPSRPAGVPEGGGRGIPVVLVAQRGLVEVETEGLLLEDVPVGMLAPVLNLASGQVVRAMRLAQDRMLALASLESPPSAAAGSR